MNYLTYGFSFKAFGLGFNISKWAWHLDLGFLWIGGEW